MDILDYSSGDVASIWRALDDELSREGLERTLFICGGAALIGLNVISRSTRDVDVVAPKLDRDVLAAADRVGARLSLRSGWLNNGPDDLVNYLDAEWQQSTLVIYNGKALIVRSLSRQDLINTKLWAACDRIEDVADLISIKPSCQELEHAKRWVLRCDASEMWPKIVDQCVRHIEERIGDE